MHDNGRKCAQGRAGRGGGQRQGATLQQAARVTATPEEIEAAQTPRGEAGRRRSLRSGAFPGHRPPVGGSGSSEGLCRSCAHACHDQPGSASPISAFKVIGRTCLTISTAASASAEWARRKRPAFKERAGNGLREIVELPSWARHQSPRETGLCRLELSPACTFTLPLLGGGVGWGIRAESSPAVSKSLPWQTTPEFVQNFDPPLAPAIPMRPRRKGLSAASNSGCPTPIYSTTALTLQPALLRGLARVPSRRRPVAAIRASWGDTSSSRPAASCSLGARPRE
jgi:hypothetical protein